MRFRLKARCLNIVSHGSWVYVLSATPEARSPDAWDHATLDLPGRIFTLCSFIPLGNYTKWRDASQPNKYAPKLGTSYCSKSQLIQFSSLAVSFYRLGSNGDGRYFCQRSTYQCKPPKISKHLNTGNALTASVGQSRPPSALRSLLSVLDPSADLSQLNIPFLTRALKMVVKLEIQYW